MQLKSIEQYEAPSAEITAVDQRSAVVRVPEFSPGVDSMLNLTINGLTRLARVEAVLGNGQVRVDFLHSVPGIGPVDHVEKLEWKPAVTIADSARASTWSESGISWELSGAQMLPVPLSIEAHLDACCPMVKNGVTVAFLQRPQTPNFYDASHTCGARPEFDFLADEACGWALFSRTLSSDARALVYGEYSNDFERRLLAFVTGSTALFVIDVAPDMFPIVESFSVSGADTVWVVTADGRVDLLRSNSSFQSAKASAIRDSLYEERSEAEFALLTGEPGAIEEPIGFSSVLFS